MALQLLNLGSSPNDNQGDPLRTGGDKINDNFLELYARAQIWRAGSYPQRTIVLDADRAYLLAVGVVLPFVSTNFQTELTNGVWIDVQEEAMQEALNRVRFKGTWVNASYAINDMVYSSPYIGVALVDTTDTFPPVPEGAGQWLLGETPTWDTQTLVGDVATGWDIILEQIIAISDLRFWVTPQADTSYTIGFLEKKSGNFELIGSQEITSGSPTGWYELNLASVDRLMQIGAHFRVVLVTHVQTNDATTNTNYVYQIGETTVAAGDASQGAGNLFINVTDDDATDRSALLASLDVNDVVTIIEAGDQTRSASYRVTGPSVLNNTQYDIPVVLSTAGNALRDNRAVTIDFQVSGVPVNTDYVQIVDGLINESNFSGFVTQDMDDIYSNSLTTNDNLYGVDIFYVKYTTSDDWYYIPVGAGGSTASSGGGDITVIDNLTTQSATDALSANQGYVLDQKILAHLADLLNPHQTAVSNLSDYAGNPNANDRLAWDAETNKWTPKPSLSALGIFEFDYRFNTSTDATPPSGDIQRNNTDPTLATILYFNELDISNADLSNYWSRVKPGDWINMYEVGDTDRSENFDVVGASSKVGDVWHIPVNFFSQNGTPFANNMSLKILWNVEPEQDTSSFAQIVTLGETVAVNDLIYLKTDGLWWKTIATDELVMTSKILCAVLGGNVGQTVTVYNVAAIQYTGAVDMGQPVYLSTTVAGGYQTTLPTGTDFVKIIGCILVDQQDWFPEDRYFYFLPNWDYQTGDGLYVNGVPLLGGLDPTNVALLDAANVFASSGNKFLEGIAVRDSGNSINYFGVSHSTNDATITNQVGGMIHSAIAGSGSTYTYSDDVGSLLISGNQSSSQTGNWSMPISTIARITAVGAKAITSNEWVKASVVQSTVTGEPSGSDRVENCVSLTQAEYDAAAGSRVATTTYYITDAL